MTRMRRLIVLSCVAMTSAILLAIFLLLPSDDPKRPDELVPLIAWLERHPADWLAASAITDQSLDSPLPLPRRVALWRTSYGLAHYLAPLRPNTSAGFVRAGLFHWYELGPEDRAEVLKAAAPLLRDARVFQSLHRPLWELTRDLGYLRRSAPPTIANLTLLRDLAITSGEFGEYRQLRTSLRDARMNDVRARRATATIAEMTSILPHPLTADDAPLVRAILEEIDRRPFDLQTMGGRVEELALFAIRHGLHPLTAFAPLIDVEGPLTPATRARLAVALGDRAAATRIELVSGVLTKPEWIPYHLERAALEERSRDLATAALYRTRASVPEAPPRDVWTNVCSANELCTSVYREHSGPFDMTLEVAQSDEIPPYVEVYVDDVRVAEGEVRGQRTFTVTAGPGPHRTEVRLVNRYTRNGTQRRVRLS
jgi:hypothetical protein